MSIDQPPRDKMMKGAPAEKVEAEYHFAGGDGHAARVIVAHDIVEATRLYWEAEDGQAGKAVINSPEPPEKGEEV